MVKKTSLLIIILFSLPLLGIIPFSNPIPVSGSAFLGLNPGTQAEYPPSLFEFASEITSNPSSSSFSGIYVENLLADRIVQQPIGNPGYVSDEEDTVTQFDMASQFSTIGILAHNTHAGAAFFDLQTSDLIYLVTSTGEVQAFRVVEKQKYQAINPTDPYSEFSDLNDPSSLVSAQTLFLRTYGRGGVLILQTCIENSGDPSWGRLFVIAEPITIFSNSSTRIMKMWDYLYRFSTNAQIK